MKNKFLTTAAAIFLAFSTLNSAAKSNIPVNFTNGAITFDSLNSGITYTDSSLLSPFEKIVDVAGKSAFHSGNRAFEIVEPADETLFSLTMENAYRVDVYNEAGEFLGSITDDIENLSIKKGESYFPPDSSNLIDKNTSLIFAFHQLNGTVKASVSNFTYDSLLMKNPSLSLHDMNIHSYIPGILEFKILGIFNDYYYKNMVDINNNAIKNFRIRNIHDPASYESSATIEILGTASCDNVKIYKGSSLLNTIENSSADDSLQQTSSLDIGGNSFSAECEYEGERKAIVYEYVLNPAP